MLTSTGVALARRLLLTNIVKRGNHYGGESTPPMRFVSVREKVLMYVGLSFAMLSYPCYVLVNLDNYRPVKSQMLSEQTMQDLEKYRKKKAD